MKAIDRSSAESWCREHGYRLSARSLPVFCDDEESTAFSIPEDAGRRVAMAKGDMRAMRSEAELCIWLHDWDVWPSGQWHHLFHRFLLSYGIHESLSERPAFIIGREEFEAAVSIVTYSVLMLWDCHVMGSSGRSFIFYSHDEIGRKSGEPGATDNPDDAQRLRED